MSDPASRRDAEDEQIKADIVASFEENRGRYGSPRIHQDLRAGGRKIGRKRVARLMRELGLRGLSPRRRICTTDSDHDNPVADNILHRDFTAIRPNQKWVTDITYINTGEGWLFLSAIKDLFSQKIVGFAMDEHMEVSLVAKALDMALKDRRPEQDIIHHSDRGSQYTSRDYRAMLENSGVSVSMSRRGNCYDNASAESFWARLKIECIYTREFATRAEARAAVFEYIVTYYNRTRRHSSIGYKTPEEFESEYYESLEKAS